MEHVMKRMRWNAQFILNQRFNTNATLKEEIRVKKKTNEKKEHSAGTRGL